MNEPLDMRLVARSAVLSPDGRYRYRLTRIWRPDDGKVLVFVMLNPSTADASKDDPTVRKCCGFASRAGYSGMEVINLFAIRATHPTELVDKPLALLLGVENKKYIRDTVDGRDVVFAWGRYGADLGGMWLQEVVRFTKKLAREIFYLKMLEGQVPGHPLHLPYSCTLRRWEG